MPDLPELEEKLASQNKAVRLKALKLALFHSDATTLDLVRYLCSPDNRNGEFGEVFELHQAMTSAWARIRGIDDDKVYDFLSDSLDRDPEANRSLVRHLLFKIGTKRAMSLRQKTTRTPGNPAD